MPMTHQQEVRAFAGENRLLSDPDLPDNVSPDAQNCDYSRMTIKKRDGFVKLHTSPVLDGGIRIDNTADTKCIWIPKHTDYRFTGDFTIEICVRIISDSFTANSRIISHYLYGTGWRWYIVLSNKFNFTHTSATTGTANTSVTVTGGIVPSTWYHLVARRTGTTLNLSATDMSSGTTYTATATCNGVFADTTVPLYVGATEGATPVAQTSSQIVDEIRIWGDYRTDDEISSFRYKELTDSEIDDTYLVGYWRCNDNKWNVVTDLSKNKNHGAMSSSGPSFERSIVPQQSSEGFCVRFDGINDYGSAPYHADYAPVLNTSNTWTLEAWLRLDKPCYDVSVGSPCIMHFGSWSTGNGAVVGLHLYSSGDASLYVSYSTTTTKNNYTQDTGYDFVPGVPVHVAVTRNAGTVTVYINGVVVLTDSGATTENGPTSSTSYGMFFGGRNSAGSWSANLYAPVTIDEVRLWNTARGIVNINSWMNRSFPDVKHSNLIGYWRFDQSDKEKDETARSNAAFLADGTKPRWSYGRVYPADPPPVLLLAPVAKVATDNETLAGGTTFDREVIVGTQATLWSVAKDTANPVTQRNAFGESVLNGWCQFRDWVIFGNGIDSNFKYQGKELPKVLTLSQPTACTAAAGAAGSLTGSYSYRISFRNSYDGTESLASSAATVTLSAQKGSLSSIPLYTGPDNQVQVNQRRIYRLDPGSTTYRYLADISDNTTTTYTDDTASVSANEAINDYRGDLVPCKHWAVFGNRIWAANSGTFPSGLYFSEVNTWDFPAANVIYVERGDGDEITGLAPAFGGLVIFKRRNIYFLSGDGPTSFQLRPLNSRHGCVSGQTIGMSPKGLYYLGRDGVYLLSGDSEPEYVSINQQSIFKTLAVDTAAFSAGVYIPNKHMYLCSFDTATASAGDFYDLQPELFRGYWRLDSSGVTADGGLTLSASGSPTYTRDAIIGPVLTLPGSAYLQGGSGSASLQWSSSGHTLGGWCYINAIPGSEVGVQAIGNTGGTDFLAISITTTLQLRANHMDFGSAYTPKYSVPLNKWFHYAVSCSSSSFKIYINGYEFSTKTTSTMSSASGTARYTIGTIQGGTAMTGRLHNVWSVRANALTKAQISDIYRAEVGTEYGNRNRITMVYDENTQTWAKWDKGFDCFCNAAHTGNQAETLAASRGFVYRLFSGSGDGFTDQYGSRVTKSGTLSGASGSSITDSSASFPTEGFGLAGTDVLCVDSTTGAKQRRLILYNTATVLYLDQPILPAVTGTYYVGPIEWYWESRWMDMSDAFTVKRFYRFAMWLTENDPATTVTFKYKSDYSETWVSTTFDNTDEWTKFVMNHRGRKLKVRFENNSGDNPIDIASFTAFFSQRESV